MRVSLVLLVMVLLAACATTPEQELIEDILVRRGTSEYIEKRGDRDDQLIHAQNILRIADIALVVLDGEPTTTVDLLYDVVVIEAKINEMNPMDRLDAEALLAFLRSYLEEKLGQVEIGSDRVLRVRDFIENVRYVAKVYTI